MLPPKKKQVLMRTLDAINGYGRDTVHYLAQGAKDAPWRMRRDLMSKLFTTQADELLVVKAG